MTEKQLERAARRMALDEYKRLASDVSKDFIVPSEDSETMRDMIATCKRLLLKVGKYLSEAERYTEEKEKSRMYFIADYIITIDDVPQIWRATSFGPEDEVDEEYIKKSVIEVHKTDKLIFKKIKWDKDLDNLKLTLDEEIEYKKFNEQQIKSVEKFEP